MGKKGKANKLAKMSEEERARYMQMRADVEEEARRRKVQLISLFMKVRPKKFLKNKIRFPINTFTIAFMLFICVIE